MTLLLCLMVIVLHEAGHLLAARLLGAEIKAIRLTSIRHSALSPGRNLVIALAGPLANLLFAIFCWHLFGLYNLVFGLANLLPFSHSDGRQAWGHWKLWKAEAVTRKRQAGAWVMARITGR